MLPEANSPPCWAKYGGEPFMEIACGYHILEVADTQKGHKSPILIAQIS